MTLIKYIGPLRIGLALLVLILVLSAPFADNAEANAFTGTIAPALTLVMLWVVPLDILMSSVFMSDSEGAERLRYRRALWFDIALEIALLLSWGPFFASALQQTF